MALSLASHGHGNVIVVTMARGQLHKKASDSVVSTTKSVAYRSYCFVGKGKLNVACIEKKST